MANFHCNFGKISSHIPARVVLAIMAFLACFHTYMIRNILSVTILDMVEGKATGGHVPECRVGNVTIESKSSHDRGPRYPWGENIQGSVLSAYGYGYMVTQIPGGILAEAVGSRMVVFTSLLIMVVLCALTPLAAELNYGAIIALRIIVGLAGGVMYPSLHAIIARWAPPQEKSKFVWALLGGTFGTVISFALTGVIVERVNWPAAYYIFAAITAVFCVAWLLLVYNTPSDHPRISEEEKEYIEKSILQQSDINAKGALPVLKLAMSLPFIALIILHYGTLWGLYLLINLGPKYLSDVLDFNTVDSGGYSTLPHLARVVFGLGFSTATDIMMTRKTMRPTYIRKLFVIFSHFLPGLLLFVLPFVGCHAAWNLTLITLSLGMNGAATVTNLANHHDLAPRFAGSLYGIMNGIGGTSAFIVPGISGHILTQNNGLSEWGIIFMVGGGFYVFCGAFYLMFGSGELQPWAGSTQDSTPPTPPPSQ